MKQNKNEFSNEDEENIYSDTNDTNTSKNTTHNLNEEPYEIIERILIMIYNRNIKPDKTKPKINIESNQNKIKELCKKYDTSYIVLLLLKSIRKLINKYREIIFDLPTITKILRETYSLEYKERSYSQNYKFKKIDQFQKFINYFKTDNNITPVSKSLNKYKNPNTIMKSLFAELYNIKKCLRKSAPIINKIFEYPLSKYEKFSIDQCQKEEYLNILIRDKFIANEINKNIDPKLIILLNEISEGNYLNSKLMTEKLNYFNIKLNQRKEYAKYLTIAEIGSSIDEKCPEDCELLGVTSINNIYNFINEEDINNNYFLSAEGDLDFDIIEDDNIKESNNFPNINMIHFGNGINNIESNQNIINEIDTNTYIPKIKDAIINQNEVKKQSIISNNKINSINISENKNFLDVPNLFTKNKNINKDFKKIFNFDPKNKKTRGEYANILNDERLRRGGTEQAIIKDIKNNNNKNKVENKGNKFANNNKNLKSDKKEIPSDLDDLVKYIEKDDKKTTQNKKKKKNKKRNKKKNKNEAELNEDKDEKNEINVSKDKEDNDEIEDIKQNFINNSINRYKIHKIKFKYGTKWLEKISKYE